MKITIPGKPQPKQRPRMTRTGIVYTPKATVSYEETVRQYALAAGVEPHAGPVSLRITVLYQTPKSWSKKKKAAKVNTAHTQKPDADNIIKTIKDGLNRIAYIDDSQVFSVSAIKTWIDGESAVVIEIENC